MELFTRSESQNDCCSNWRQLLVPEVLVPDVLTSVYSDTSGSHLGVTKHWLRYKNRFYWLASRSDIEDWIQHCGPCNASKRFNARGRAKMQVHNIGYFF